MSEHQEKSLFTFITYLSKSMCNRCPLRYEMKCHGSSRLAKFGSEILARSPSTKTKNKWMKDTSEIKTERNGSAIELWWIHDISLSSETCWQRRAVWYFSSRSCCRSDISERDVHAYLFKEIIYPKQKILPMLTV